jgi:hypothetical protein
MGGDYDGIARKAVTAGRLLNANNYRLAFLATTLARLRIIVVSIAAVAVGV